MDHLEGSLGTRGQAAGLFLPPPLIYNRTAAQCRKVNVKRSLGVDSAVSIEIDQCPWPVEYKCYINQSAVL